MNKLERQHAALVERIAARRAELEPIARRLDAIPAEMIDAEDDQDLVALLAEYEQLKWASKVLLLELGELERRGRLGFVAICEAAMAAAERAYEKAQETARDHYRTAQALSKDMQSAQNGNVPEDLHGDRAAIDLYLVDLAGQKARAWAVSSAAGRERDRQSALPQRAQAELAQVQAGAL
jgi:hypothetical protein